MGSNGPGEAGTHMKAPIPQLKFRLAPAGEIQRADAAV